MFEQTFKNQLAAVSTDEALIEKFWQEIKRDYSKPGRHYHTLTHLDNLTTELTSVKESIADWQILVFSIAYHDVIYNTLKKDNEERSAKLAYERLSQLMISDTKKRRCVAQILATKVHESSDDSDTNYFTDADLAILGADKEHYRRYASMIRKEYKIFPDFVYRPGRQKVLRHFLEMPNIYKTVYFCDKYEVRAKENLRNELDELDS
jgi:predicted metal-dependent HD superfamily phosphohydrolase